MDTPTRVINLAAQPGVRYSVKNPYAYIQKANELMAHSYSHLFGLPTTGRRYFTVWSLGPTGHVALALHQRDSRGPPHRCLQPRQDAA